MLQYKFFDVRLNWVGIATRCKGFFGVNLEGCLRNLIQCLYLSLDLRGFFYFKNYIYNSWICLFS